MIPRFKPWLGWPEFFALFKPNKGAVEKFEKEFAKSFQAVDAVAFPYGRSAQWAFFKALGIKDAEVIMPAYTCSVVAHAVTLSDNTPRFIDIDLYDYNMNLEEAEAAINENTRAIIATHTFGYPQDLYRLETMVQKAEQRFGHKVWLVQDCCHAFSAEWKGRMVGTSGDVAVYAFNISKIMTSIFGGMLTFQDQALADRVRAWRDAHYEKASWMKAVKRRLYLLAVYIAFNEKFYGLTWWLQEKTPLLNRFTKAYHLDDTIHFPPDYLDKMLDVEAAVGLEQLRRYPQIIQRRRDNVLWYDEHLERREGWVMPPIVKGATYSHYVVRVPDRQSVLKEFSANGTHLGELIQYSIPELASYKTSVNVCEGSLNASSHTVNFSVTRPPPRLPTHKPERQVTTQEFNRHWKNANYLRLSQQKTKIATDFLNPVIKKIKNSNDVLTILDAGCGDGVHARVLLENVTKNFKYVGVDISGVAISSSEKRVKNDDRFSFQQLDLSREHLGAEIFDIVFSYGVIAYTNNPRETIRNLSCSLKPGGLFVSWIYSPKAVQKRALQLLRYLARLTGTKGTDKIATLIVFLMKYLPISSGVNLTNSTFDQCKETVLVNIAPRQLWLPTSDEANSWFLLNGLTLIPECSDNNRKVYLKK